MLHADYLYNKNKESLSLIPRLITAILTPDDSTRDSIDEIKILVKNNYKTKNAKDIIANI